MYINKYIYKLDFEINLDFTSLNIIDGSIASNICARATFLRVACSEEKEKSSYSDLFPPFCSLKEERRNKNASSMGANNVIAFWIACKRISSPLISRIRANFLKFLFLIIFVAIELTHRYAFGINMD